MKKSEKKLEAHFCLSCGQTVKIQSFETNTEKGYDCVCGFGFRMESDASMKDDDRKEPAFTLYWNPPLENERTYSVMVPAGCLLVLGDEKV